MKKMRKILAVVFALLLVFSLASCSAVETERGGEIKVQCAAMLDAIIANDADAAYALLVDGMDKTSFREGFAELREYIAGVETYELTQAGWYTGIDNGMSYYEATFKMETNAGTFYVIALEVTGYEGLYNFRIVSEEEMYPSYTGTLTTLAGSNFLQWAVLLFSAACIVFVIFMLVDCFKRKIKYKPLWIVLILCGALVFAVTFDASGLNFNFNIGVFVLAYSYFQLYSTGAFVFKLVVPFGAILYLILRKHVTLPEKSAAAEAPAAEPEAENEETPAGESPTETQTEAAEKNKEE